MDQSRVEVDRAICIGSGDCIRVAPQAFDLDSDGLAFVVDSGTTPLDALRLAVDSCPSGAIRMATDLKIDQ